MRLRVFIFLTCIILAEGMARTGPGQTTLVPTHARVETLLSLFAPPAFAAPATPDLPLKLPLKPNSVRFAVIGDSGSRRPSPGAGSGNGSIPEDRQLQLCADAGGQHLRRGQASRFYRKFEEPYKPLLDAGVKFYASLGNHDNPNERLYKLFNMGGKRYYSFSKRMTLPSLRSTAPT